MPAKKVAPLSQFESARAALLPSKAPGKIKLPRLAKPPITSWSLSRIKMYEQCPLQARFKYVEKLPEAPSPAMARGDKIHKAIEAFLRYGKPSLAYMTAPGADDIAVNSKLRGFFQDMRAQYVKHNLNAECELAFDRDWKPTSWFDADKSKPVVYVRTKADALLMPKRDPNIVVYDWKTGKIREEEYADTVEMYAISALAAGVGEQAGGSLVYTDHGEFRESSPPIKLSQLPKLLKKWDERAKPMLADKLFAPRPSDKCRWCSWNKSKGGPCIY